MWVLGLIWINSSYIGIHSKTIKHLKAATQQRNATFSFLFSFPQSKAFEKTANQVKQKKRWENKKMKVLFIGIGVAALLVIIGLIIFAIVNSTGEQ